MPFYYELRSRENDPADVRAWKKRCATNLIRLRQDLTAHFQAHGAGGNGHHDSKGYLRLATWNIREFDEVPGKGGGRIDESYFYIAEIMSCFDLIAVQEVREDLAALNRVLSLLGPDYDFVATDVAPPPRGNKERMAFVYNRRKVWFRKIIGELTLGGKQRLMLPDTFHAQTGKGVEIELPAGEDLVAPTDLKLRNGGTSLREPVAIDLPEGTRLTLPKGAQLIFDTGKADELPGDGTLDLGTGRVRAYSKKASVRIPPKAMEVEALEFARTPFTAVFQAGWLKLMLCTVHIYYGDEKGLKLERRRQEIETLTEALAKRAQSEKDSDADNFFFVLGDFNIVDKDHQTWDALHRNEFMVPPELKEIPAGSNVKRNKAYDQIAIWTGDPAREQHFRQYTGIDVTGAGIFDFFKSVFRAGDDDPGGKDKAVYVPLMKARKPNFDDSKYPEWRTYQMSDHLPMWVDLKIDFSDDYLNSLITED